MYLPLHEKNFGAESLSASWARHDSAHECIPGATSFPKHSVDHNVLGHFQFPAPRIRGFGCIAVPSLSELYASRRTSQRTNCCQNW